MPDKDASGFNDPSTVWVINRTGYHDYSPAKRYGDLRSVTENRVNIRNSERLEAEIQEALSSATAHDYILLSGHALLNVLAVVFMYKRFGEVKVLYYDQIMKDYHVRNLDFGRKRLEI